MPHLFAMFCFNNPKYLYERQMRLDTYIFFVKASLWFKTFSTEKYENM